MIPFDKEFAAIEAEDFIEQVLVERLGAEHGLGRGELPLRRQGEGRPGDARRRASEFETRVVPLVEVDGETVSSTRIRALVAAGEVEAAQRCLGAPFMLEGRSSSGDRRGRELGFPTANLVPDDRLVDPRPRRLRGVRQRPPGGGQRRRAADLRDAAAAC